MWHKSFLTVLVGGWAAFGLVLTATSQDLCEAIVQGAMSAVGVNCAALPGNTACYGHAGLTATPAAGAAEGTFISPGSRAELPTLGAIQTSALNPQTNEWGVAALRLPANDAVFVMMGDVTLIQGLSTAQSIADALDRVPVTTAEATNLLASPAPDAPALAGVTAFTVAMADATSDNGVFVRAQANGQVGWLPVEALVPNPLIDTLPTASPPTEDPTPDETQAPSTGVLSFETGGASPCALAPNRLLVQTPTGSPLNITLNNIPLQIDATATFGIEDYQGQTVLYIFTLDGSVTVEPDSPSPTTIPGGFVSYTPLTATAFETPTEVDINGSGFFDLGYYLTETLIPAAVTDRPVAVDGIVTETACTYRAIGLQAAGRLGPGEDRNVRAYLDENTDYTAIETVTLEDGNWYGLEDESFGVLYTNENDLTESCVTTTREVRTICELEVVASEAQVGGYTGPADNRTIVLYFDPGTVFSPVNSEFEADGDQWFEVQYATAGRETLWVKGDNFPNLEGCDDLTEETAASPTATPAAEQTPLPTATTIPLGGEFVVTLSSCTLNGPTYTQAWEINGVPPDATEITFVGNNTSSVSPTRTIVTVLDTRGEMTAYASTPDGRVDARAVYAVACSGLIPTRTPSPVPTPTAAPTTVAFSGNVESCTASGSNAYRVAVQVAPIPANTQYFVVDGGASSTNAGNPIVFTTNIPPTFITGYTADGVPTGGGPVRGVSVCPPLNAATDTN